MNAFWRAKGERDRATTLTHARTTAIDARIPGELALARPLHATPELDRLSEAFARKRSAGTGRANSPLPLTVKTPVAVTVTRNNFMADRAHRIRTTAHAVSIEHLKLNPRGLTGT